MLAARHSLFAIALIGSPLICSCGPRLARCEDDFEKGLYAETARCVLTFESTRAKLHSQIPFRIVLKGDGERRRLCLSYLADRPQRWLVTNKEGHEHPFVRYDWAPSWGKPYDGPPVPVLIPDGAYLTIKDSFHTGRFTSDGLGKYVVWVRILHMPPGKFNVYRRHSAWPENDKSFWRGIIESNEVEIEIVE